MRLLSLDVYLYLHWNVVAGVKAIEQIPKFRVIRSSKKPSQSSRAASGNKVSTARHGGSFRDAFSPVKYLKACQRRSQRSHDEKRGRLFPLRSPLNISSTLTNRSDSGSFHFLCQTFRGERKCFDAWAYNITVHMKRFEIFISPAFRRDMTGCFGKIMLSSVYLFLVISHSEIVYFSFWYFWNKFNWSNLYSNIN